jgi:deoxycytidylate deaminase
MNILETEFPFIIEAKTSKLNEKTKVIYSFAEPYHNCCIDKKEIINEQIKSCENLLKYTNNKNDSLALENEITELKLALDILI